jgi:phosphatidylserine/phosphatidylglycerophosphate/cardiolipin synthase-like enzyme
MQKISSSGFLNRSLASAVLVLAILACSLSQGPAVGSASTQTPPFSTAVPGAGPAANSGLTEIPLLSGYGARGPFFEIYFTDPFNPASAKEEGGPDMPLVAAINAARISVDVAAYSLNLYSIQDALLHAYNRGVLVRMVMESDNMNNPAVDALKGAGIPIIGDQRDGLMHDKFMVIDRTEVWTGSMNFTGAGVYQDNNNLVRIISSKVAQDYTSEFEEMFKDDFFGPDSIAQTPYPLVTEDGVGMEIYFSPDDHPAARIVTLLRRAKHSIHFLAYSFTANDFGDIIVQQARAGLQVSGVMEESQVKTNQGTEFDRFTQAGLPVYLDGNAGQMHHKVIIIDNQIVITGSYNFSSSAERTNDENVVIFFDPGIAARYMAEFERVYAEAQK